MLYLKNLSENALKVFLALAASPLMKDFVLIGGTALALQINHRRSNDLDFWFPSKELSKRTIGAIVTQLRDAGFDVQQATPASRISQGRINGIDVLKYGQDFAIDNVKVTFFARLDSVYKAFQDLPQLNLPGVSFSLMSQDGIFAMKSHLIHERIRSRDLYDLMTFMQRGKTLEEALRQARRADPSSSSEYAKDVLYGIIPLPASDEGFDCEDNSITTETVYENLRKVVDQHEQDIAAKVLL